MTYFSSSSFIEFILNLIKHTFQHKLEQDLKFFKNDVFQLKQKRTKLIQVNT